MKPLPLVDRISKLVGRRVCWLYLIAVFFSVYEVVADFVFNSPTVWVHDLTIILCSACFLLGGAYAMQRQEHIRITVLYDYLPPGLKRRLDVITLAFALFYMVLLSYFATVAAIESIGLVERSGRAWDFPMPMVVRISFCLGSILLTVQIASHFLTLLRGAALPDSNREASSESLLENRIDNQQGEGR